MAIARVTYTYTGGSKNFVVPFPYLSRDHIRVYVNGNYPPSYSWLNPQTISIPSLFNSPSTVEIVRSSSPHELLVNFNDGSTITETDLNTLARQSFYLVQESADIADAALLDATNALTASQSATATANAAASTANSASTTAGTALNTANTANTKATEALTTANTAASNASTALNTANAASQTANTASGRVDGAVNTANTALTTANTAKSTADTAKSTADTAKSTADTALANSQSAVSMADSATQSAGTAQTAATTAQEAAVTAASDASAASALATVLQGQVEQVLEDVQAIVGGDLTDFTRNSQNLSELDDMAQARTNLGLGNVDNTADADKPVSTAVQTALNAKANASHTHTIANVTGLQGALDGKASSSHGHAIADVSGLQTALNGKAASIHTHSIAQVSGLQDELDTRANLSHSHLWSDIHEKPTTFPPSNHTHSRSQISGLSNAVDYSVGDRIPSLFGFDFTAHKECQSDGFWSTDTINRNSVYAVNRTVVTMPGVSSGSAWWFVWTMIHTHGISRTQIAFSLQGTPQILMRSFEGTFWTAWHTVAWV